MMIDAGQNMGAMEPEGEPLLSFALLIPDVMESPARNIALTGGFAPRAEIHSGTLSALFWSCLRIWAPPYGLLSLQTDGNIAVE
jgi:hypothetical protein